MLETGTRARYRRDDEADETTQQCASEEAPHFCNAACTSFAKAWQSVNGYAPAAAARATRRFPIFTLPKAAICS